MWRAKPIPAVTLTTVRRCEAATIYISCGDGFIDVRDAGDPAYRQISRIKTVRGARTSLFVPDLDRLLLAVRAQAGEPAAIWVYGVAAEPAGDK